MGEHLPADHVTGKEFSVGFRGFDQHEVRSFLAQVAAELAAGHERERLLQARFAELEASGSVELDEAALERALGVEAMSVLHAAREAAAEIRAKAEHLRSEAVERADAVTATARAEARRQAEAIVEEARGEAHELVTRAVGERDRVLSDLADRRQTMVTELDGLHAARQRLVDAYRHVRRSLDEAIQGAVDADDAASVAEAADVAPTPAPAEAVVEDPPAPMVEEPEHEEPDELAHDVHEEPEVVDDRDLTAESEPSDPAPDPGDERRSSSLRLLRRPNDVGEGIEPEEDFEGVRIIRPEAGDEADTGPQPVVQVDAEGDLEPARNLEPEAATVELEDEAPVDNLFARLRADRADKVARAELVLAGTGDDEAATESPAPESTTAPSPDLSVLAVRDESLADAERALVKLLKRALADEQNEVLDGLRRLKGAPSTEALLPDPAVHDARYDAVLSGAAGAAAEMGGKVAGGATSDARAVTAELGHSVAADLRLRVGRAIDEASGDIDTLAEAISSIYREWKTARTDPLARDAIAASFAAGQYAAIDGAVQWVVDPAEGGCPDCDDNALAGAVAKGTPFPTGQLHPPAHAGCRCALVAASLDSSS